MFTADDVFHRIFIPRPDWFDDAECRGMGPDIFFPEGRGGSVGTNGETKAGEKWHAFVSSFVRRSNQWPI